MLTRDRLIEVLRCDPKAGEFTWRLQPGSRSDMIGKRAGYNGPGKYRSITIDGEGHLIHRLMWLYVHGQFPAYQLEHINKNPADNRIANLREAVRSPNYRGDEVHVKLFNFDEWELEDRDDLTQELLKIILHYNQKTGEFHWLVKPASRTHAGDLAGHLGAKGYRYIGIAGKTYLAHRLAWLYVYGKFPGGLDHKNRKTADNRISNLREATKPQNGGNAKGRKEGKLKGAYWHKREKRWASAIGVKGKSVWLGQYATEEEAHAAYCDAARKKYKEFFYAGQKR
jgi:hypothetical protein